MRAGIIAFLALATAGCAPGVQEVPLAGLDLADPATLARLQAELPLNDRAPFATYALLHWPKSKFYCGEPIGGTRPPAATIGEAIDQTRAYESALQSAQARASAADTSATREREKALIDRIDRLVFERDRLRGASDPTIVNRTDLAIKIEQQLQSARGELEQLRQ